MNQPADHTPVISVIIAVFNAADTLDKCLASILAQSYPEVQLIVMDGGSSDGSVDIIREYSDAIAYWESMPDRGIYHAWNKALRHASGDWVCFLGADDYFWSDDTLEILARHLAALPLDTRLAYGQAAVVNSRDEVLYLNGMDWSLAGRRFHDCMSIPHPGLLHRKSLFAAHGMFDERYRIAGDYEFLLRELPRGTARFLPGIVSVGVRAGGISRRPGNILLQLREARLAQKAHGYPYPGRNWLLSMAKAHARNLLWRLAGEKTTRKLFDLGRRLLGLPPFWTRT